MYVCICVWAYVWVDAGVHWDDIALIDSFHIVAASVAAQHRAQFSNSSFTSLPPPFRQHNLNGPSDCHFINLFIYRHCYLFAWSSRGIRIT